MSVTPHSYSVIIHAAGEDPDAPIPVTFRVYDAGERATTYLLRDHLVGLAGDGVRVAVEVTDLSLQPEHFDRLGTRV
jgi:hypothetical protein